MKVYVCIECVPHEGFNSPSRVFSALEKATKYVKEEYVSEYGNTMHIFLADVDGTEDLSWDNECTP